MIEYLMWFVSIISLVGTIANVYQRRWCFGVWAVTNALWVIYDIHKTAYPQAALMFTYWLLALWGLKKWKAKATQ